MKVICISGKAGHGKDTLAQFLQGELIENGYRVFITHYADLLKYVCTAFFGWDGKKDEHGRAILQYVGTDVVRKRNPDFWVNFIASILKFFGDCWDVVIIPDARFRNEIEVLEEHEFDVTHIRVERDGYDGYLTSSQKEHASETALDDVEPDVLIKNNGLESLRMAAKKWIKENGYGN
jgi:DNA replication protein